MFEIIKKALSGNKMSQPRGYEGWEDEILDRFVCVHCKRKNDLHIGK